jgi:hypothetical protein
MRSILILLFVLPLLVSEVVACDEGGGGGQAIKYIGDAKSANEGNPCQTLIDSAIGHEDKFECQESYDYFQEYFESCASMQNSWLYFLNIGAVNDCRNQNNNRFGEFREWLKKVLYYNRDTSYYCADVRQILSTFAWFDDTRQQDLRGRLAVAYFLVNENRCPNLTAYYDTLLIPNVWHGIYQKWLDTVADPDHAVFDSTLPTLEDLDLGILRSNPSDVKHFNDVVIGPLISGLNSVPNPFTSDTKISFNCREMALLKFEIYDILGKKVYEGGEHVYDKGENSITLSGNDLPHGILYVRFMLPDGSVNTIKLRKVE